MMQLWLFDGVCFRKDKEEMRKRWEGDEQKGETGTGRERRKEGWTEGGRPGGGRDAGRR